MLLRRGSGRTGISTIGGSRSLGICRAERKIGNNRRGRRRNIYPGTLHRPGIQSDGRRHEEKIGRAFHS